MKIRELYIQSFGTLQDRRFSLNDGLNVIYGENESGKTSLAYFIKFLFYGLNGKGLDKRPSEKERFVNWNTGLAAGYALVEKDGKEYRLERSVRLTGGGREGRKNEYSSEPPVITSTESGNVLAKDTNPGIFFFGMDEDSFLRTVFVDQMSGTLLDADDVRNTVENLLVTGHEETDIEDALKNLDRDRTRLLHKNGNGGALYDSQKKLTDSEERLRRARANAESLQKVEAELNRLEAMMREKQNKKDRCKKTVDACELLAKKKALDDWTEVNSRIEAWDRKIENDPDKQLTDMKLAALKQLKAVRTSQEQEIDELEPRIQKTDRMISQMEDTVYAGIEPEEEITRLRRFEKRVTVARVLFVSGLLIMAGGALLGAFRLLPLLPWSAAAGGLGFILAVGGLFGWVRNEKKRKTLRQYWRLSPEDRNGSEEIRRKHDSARKRQETEAERNVLSESLRTIQKMKEKTEWEIARECSFLTEASVPEEQKLDKAIEETRKATEKRKQWIAERERLKGESAALHRLFDDVDVNTLVTDVEDCLKTEYGREAAQLDKNAVAQKKQELSFYEVNLPLQMNQILKKREEKTALMASYVDPATAENERNFWKDETEEQRFQLEAVTLASSQLEKASQQLRQTVLPRILTKAQTHFSAFSRGKYESMQADDALKLSCFDGSGSRSAGTLSSGTMGLLYLSIRLAMIGVLEKEDTPVAVLDETFSNVDDIRLRETMRCLKETQPGQLLLFSCRLAEKNLADEMQLPVIVL